MGADAVLVNTAIAAARDPVRMAKAFKASSSVPEVFEAGLPSRLITRSDQPTGRFLETIFGSR